MASYGQYADLVHGTGDAAKAKDGDEPTSPYQPYSTKLEKRPTLEMPQFGATFVPGGFDDFMMPEVVAPSPQRVTPQVPQNMQEGIQRMELEARTVTSSSDGSSTAHGHVREPSLSTYMRSSASDVQTPPASDSGSKPFEPTENRSQQNLDAATTRDAPSFSPFPKVKGENIPPSDDEKEDILWNARKHVLHSQNVSMQIIWARDVLIWAEISTDAAGREDQPRSGTPRIEHELRIDAINIINYLAGQEHPDALYMQSKWLEFGKFGHRTDKRDAYTGYKRAAELGNKRSEYRMGMLYEQSNDMSKAKEHYYKGLSLGDSAALYRMGMMSLLGQHGESKDFARALERIRSAADSADEDAPQGSYVYGMLVGRDLPDISLPEGILPFNLETAKVYVEKAAYMGFGKAQLKMGQAYELCQLSCEFNPSYSLHYYGLAAKQGLPEAALGVSRWFLFGYEGVFKKNEELAFKYAQDAAKAKLPTGAFAMGYYYEIGIHVSKNIVEAKRWYNVAADAGNKDAVGRLEALDHDNSLSKQDHETTTLTRIKSQHGSQRGKRPERFKQAQHMPTLSEDGQAPVIEPALPTPPLSRTTPPRSPGMHATNAPEEPPYPSSAMPSDRPPAFSMRLDQGGRDPNARPVSAMPYPDDDRPAPLDLSRPKSAAPYPDDDVQGRLYGRQGPGGPAADRPGSAFGIKNGPRPLAGTQSMGNLQPTGPDGRGRMPVGGGGPGGYRQPSPGPPGGYGREGLAPYPQSGMQQARPSSAQPYPSGGPGPGPAGGRMSQPPPGQYGRGQLPSQGGGLPPAGMKPRTSSRPVSGLPPQQQQQGSQPLPGGRGEWSGTLPHHNQRLSSAPAPGGPGPKPGGYGPGPAGGPPSFGRPPAAGSPAPGGPRVGTAPPGQQSMRPEAAKPGIQPSATAPAKPAGGKGPATFDDMGIPHAKREGDCVVM